MKKTLSIFLSIVLAMTSCVFAISASADDSKYTFDKNTKTLTITGVSTVSASLFDDFEKVYGNAVNNSSDESASTSPSGDAYSAVENICLEKGVQTVEKNAFADFSNLKNLIVYNPYCSLAPEGILASVNRVAIYTFDVSGSTVKDYAEKRDDIDFNEIYPENWMIEDEDEFLLLYWTQPQTGYGALFNDSELVDGHRPICHIMVYRDKKGKYYLCIKREGNDLY